MSRHDAALRLRDMLHHARKVQQKVAGVERSRFDEDEDLRVVITWHLLVVGEAASHVPESQRQAMPAVPWQRVVGMRHRLVHGYGTIDNEIVWVTATHRIGELVEELEQWVGD